MLHQLTQYLLQFHQVHVPMVGTLRVVQQPASLDVASKCILPPQYILHFSEDGLLAKHQLWYFEMALKTGEAATRRALEEAGMQLKKQIEQEAFVWKGIGNFSYKDQKIIFTPQPHESLLQPVAAERVLRENVQHTVLQGDHVVLSDGSADGHELLEQPRDWSRLAGWVVVVLSLFFILFYLYQHQFQATSSGLHEKVNPAPPAATYQQSAI